jgi:hypothetical protein
MKGTVFLAAASIRPHVNTRNRPALAAPLCQPEHMTRRRRVKRGMSDVSSVSGGRCHFVLRFPGFPPSLAPRTWGTRPGGKACEDARDLSHSQRMTLTSAWLAKPVVPRSENPLSRRHMGHAGVYRLARLDIDTRCIVFKAVDGLARWSFRKGRSGSRCLWIRHRVSPYFSTTRLEVWEGSTAAFSATISRISGAAS